MLKKIAAAAALTAVVSSSAMAGPFIINPGFNGVFSADGDTLTAPISQLGYTGTLATSIYLGNPAVAGTAVIDTNDAATILATGLPLVTAPGSNFTAIDGITSVNLRLPTRPGDVNIDALNFVNPSSTDVEGFTNSSLVPYGFPGSWGLTYTYTLFGTTTGTGVNFTSGKFDVFLELAAPTKVLELIVTGSTLNAANLDIFGYANYSFCAPACGALIENLFFDVNSGNTFYQNWLNGDGQSVKWTLDTNVNPPVPTPSQLVATPTGALVRQTTLDGSIGFVPEPSALALFGLGLLGFGLSRRAARKAA